MPLVTSTVIARSHKMGSAVIYRENPINWAGDLLSTTSGGGICKRIFHACNNQSVPFNFAI